MEQVRFLRHEACPECGSRDNRGVWSDGHTHCFGCGARTGNRGGYVLRDFIRVHTDLKKQEEGGAIPPLPEDVSTYIPEVPYSWLKLCLTDVEILSHRIGWSQSRESIIFPVFDKQGNLLMWQARYFGQNKDYPKYLTKGNKGDILHVLGEFPSDRVVLVEDLISAIVVSRKENAMPLWGSTIHLRTLRQLARFYVTVVFWLDADKLQTSVKAQGPARLLFESVNVLCTESDPKYQTEEQLTKILGEGIDKRDQP